MSSTAASGRRAAQRRAFLRTVGTAGALALALLWGCNRSAGPGNSKQVQLPGIAFSVPAAWEARAPQTSMRVAEFVLPESNEQATLVLFRFPGGGGTAEANVQRWISQFSQPDGSSSESKARMRTTRKEPLSLTELDVRGNYAAQAMPGAPPQPAIDSARLLALVVEGSGDPYYIKLLGPAAVIDHWEPAWTELVASLEPHAE